MLCANKHLVLFTAEFPYGNKSETFLETEIIYLSRYFLSVTILPSKKSETCRRLPDNVTIDDRLTNINPGKYKKLNVLFLNFLVTIKLLISELTDKGIKNILKNGKEYLDFVAKELIKSSYIEKHLADEKREIILYDYWFQNSTLALSILKEKKRISGFVSRGHGYDIYDERNKRTGIKFRKWIIERIRTVYIISEFGARYFCTKIDNKYHSKIRVSKLGVSKPDEPITIKVNPITIIVSCSSMLPFKQVERIPIILSQIDHPIHWVHFGSGPTQQSVEANCKKLPEHITYELKGHVNNQEVLDFYQNTNVDLFISLSTSEGLPVSMMEAQSYGIPILANPIGGIPELVIPAITGHLFKESTSDIEYSNELIKALHTNFEHTRIIKFFEENFNAKVNYTNFINELCSSEK